ncbi:uncharacterized protein LOC132264006 isoform X2 [Phlebotomus argentipes]|uniref:uncharacterized protein LOC132264006 isoform X2 n=1 Tax=Phlebotomus argentipes TaxID=94469 RepID=UPI002892E2C4|nr:uncharacterized protein LOC132264006 isoform X2 [Phlebotomus argentipes]
MSAVGKLHCHMLTIFIIILMANDILPLSHNLNRIMSDRELDGESHQLRAGRSKRCIVVQKQSHLPHRTNSHDYDDEEDDENYRRQMKRPRKMSKNSGQRSNNTENKRFHIERPEMP